MDTITYKTAGIDVRVYLGKQHAGTIKRTSSGWTYYPKGSRKGGESNYDLRAVQRELEGK